jgi:hypothetical protein
VGGSQWEYKGIVTLVFCSCITVSCMLSLDMDMWLTFCERSVQYCTTWRISYDSPLCYDIFPLLLWWKWIMCNMSCHDDILCVALMPR